MTIIVFLVDTSASMCQRAHVNGVQKSYLDIAKGAVETFLKFRQRSQDCLGDRYMLLTFEDPPNNVKAGWKENHATFMNELKNMQSNGLTSMGEALKNAFDLLNLNRTQSGIDTYGQGRCPFYLESSVIIVLTDGGKYVFRNGIHQEIILPLHAQMPGTKLTKEPFRWDQRLFSLVLRMPGNYVEERADGKVPYDDSMIEKMCEVTGGRSYNIKSQHILNQCIESLVQKLQPGVVIHFDQLIISNGDNNIADLQFQSTKRMIYVPKQPPTQKTFPVGYWPIPEPYWSDPKMVNLPPRDAHPKIKIISPCCEEPQILRNFPIDKYELEPSPITLQILSKKESNKVWPIIVSTGMQGEMPFGYLKPNSTLTIVHLYVLPYNYSLLLPLINDLFNKFNLNPPNDWVYKFAIYVKTIPQYYCPFLRRALATMPSVPYQLVQYILPENLDNYLCPAVANYLKQMKNTAKQDHDNLCVRVLKHLKQPKPPNHQLETAKLSVVSPQKTRDIVAHPMLKETFAKMHSQIVNYDNYNIVIPTITHTAATQNYRNPYDIPRRDLIDEIARMREMFFRVSSTGINSVTNDSSHCLPISDMGNYQEYLKIKETPLRELEPTNVRQHMFGNPYKKDKNMVMVDEADLNDLAPMKSGAPILHQSSHMRKSVEQGTVARLVRKRKPGPIRKDYVFKRSALDVTCPTSSSITSEGMHMMSDLSSDDEGSSGFTGIGEDKDDTEGCLAMVCEATEEHSIEPTDVAGTSLEASEKYTKIAGPGMTEKVSKQNLFIGHDTTKSLGDNQSGTSDHNFFDMTINQPGGDVVASLDVAYFHSSQSFSSSKIKQSKISAPKEQHQLHDITDAPSPSRKRQLEREEQTALFEGALPDLGNFHNGKRPRLYQQEQLMMSNKVSSQKHPDPIDQIKRVPTTDLTAADLLAATKLDDTTLLKQESNQQVRQARWQGMYEQHCDQQQSHGEDVDSESAKHLLTSTRAREQLEHQYQRDLEQLIPSSRHEKNNDQLEQSEVNVSFVQEVNQPEHLQLALIESRLKIEDDLKKSEQTTASPDYSQEQRIELQEPVISIGQQTVSSRKPTQPEQQPESMVKQRHIKHNHPGSQWSLSNLASSFVDVSSDMADVQKISNILKTCNNGVDSDKEKNRTVQYQHGERLLTLHESRARTCAVGLVRPTDSEFNLPLPNRSTTETMIVTNGLDEDNAMQPTSNCDYNVALYSSVDVEDELELERIAELNLKTRSNVFRDIRRPGRNYTELFKHLELMQGNRSCKKKFVDMCINEARRFRRHRMIDCIQQWWERHVGNRIMDGQSKIYFSNDTPSTATMAFQGDGFMSIPPSRKMYMNSGINSVYVAEFNHINYHFTELGDESLLSS